MCLSTPCCWATLMHAVYLRLMPSVSCFHTACRSLLVDVGARMWRVRQAACASLTDLLAGRRWGQLAPHMEQVGAGQVRWGFVAQLNLLFLIP